MGVNYNPRIVTNGLELYFDSINSKSFNGSRIVSLVGTHSANLQVNVQSGYILANNTVPAQTIQSFTPNSYNEITFVIKGKFIDNGTVLSFYDTPKRFVNTGQISYISANATANSLSNTSYGITYANTSLANTYISANGTANAISIVSYGITYANTIQISYISANATANAISNTSYGITYANTSLTDTYISANATANSIGIEIMHDYPEKALAMSFYKNEMKIRLKDGDNDTTLSSSFSAANSDVFFYVIKKNTSNTSMKVYLNKSLIAQSGNTSIVGSLASNLILFSKNSQGNFMNFPLRSLMIYGRELTQTEIEIITNAMPS